MAGKMTSQQHIFFIKLEGSQKEGDTTKPLKDPGLFVQGFFSDKSYANNCKTLLENEDVEVTDIKNAETHVVLYCTFMEENYTVARFQEENPTLYVKFTKKLKKLSNHLGIDEALFTTKISIDEWEEKSMETPRQDQMDLQMSKHDFCLKIEGKQKDGDTLSPLDDLNLFVEGFFSDEIYANACKTLLEIEDVEVIDIKDAKTHIVLYCKFKEENCTVAGFLEENPTLSIKFTKKLKKLANVLKMDTAKFYTEIDVAEKLPGNQRSEGDDSITQKSKRDMSRETTDTSKGILTKEEKEYQGMGTVDVKKTMSQEMPLKEIKMFVACLEAKDNDDNDCEKWEPNRFARELTSGIFKSKCAEALTKWDAMDTKIEIQKGYVCITSNFPEENLAQLKQDYDDFSLEDVIAEALRDAELPKILGIPRDVFTAEVEIRMGILPGSKAERSSAQKESVKRNSAHRPSREAVRCRKPKELEKNQNFETEFHLFMPPALGQVLEVWIESDNKLLSSTKLEQSKSESNAWVSKAISVSRHPTLTYKYGCRSKTGNLITRALFSGTGVKETRERVLREDCLQFDIFEHLPGERDLTVQKKARVYFFRVLLSRVNESNLKTELASATVKEFQKMTAKENRGNEMYVEICNQITSSGDALTPSQLLYCTVMLSRMLPGARSLNPKVADKLLEGITQCRSEGISESDRKAVSSLMHVILYAKYGDSWNLNHVIYHFVPAVDKESVMELRKAYKRYDLKPEFGIKAAKKMCSEKEFENEQYFFKNVMWSLHAIEDFVEVLLYMQESGVEKYKADIGREHFLKKINMALQDTNTLIQLIDLWKMAVTVNDIGQTLEDILKKMDQYIVKELHGANVGKALEFLKEILDHPTFKKERRLGVILLGAFARCKNSQFHLLGIDTVKSCHSLRDGDVQEFAKEWMKMAIDFHSWQDVEIPSQRIPIVYKFLNLLVDSINEEKTSTKLKDSILLVQKFEETFQSKKALGVLHQHQNLLPTTTIILQKHLLEKIKNEKPLQDPMNIRDCILAMMDKEDVLNVDSKTMQVVVEGLLDKLAFTKGGGVEDCKIIMKFSKIWMAVGTARGRFSIDVLQHSAMKNVKHLLQLLGQEVETLTVAPSVFRNINKAMKGKKNTFELLAQFNQEPEKKDAKYWQNVFRNADNILNEQETKGKHLDILFNEYLKRIAEDEKVQIHDWKEYHELLLEKKNLTTAEGFSFKENISSEGFWGKLHDFVEIAEALDEYSSVQSFLNYCNNEIKSGAMQIFMMEVLGKDRPDHGKTSASSLEVSIFLKTSCLEKFQKNLEEMFMCDVDIVISRIRDFIPSVEAFDEDMAVLTELGYKMPHRKKSAWSSYKEYPDYKVKVRALIAVAKHIGISLTEDKKDWALLKLYAEQKEAEVMESSLYTILHQMETVKRTLQNLECDDSWEIITSLSRAKTLTKFLLEIPDEDLLHLTDATEEHSEQQIQVSTVSDLILLHKAFYQLLKSDRKTLSLENFIAIINNISKSKTLGEEGKRNIPARIDACMDNVHGLKALYQNVANREELTKEIIESALNIGNIHFEIDGMQKECIFTLKYKKNRTEFTQNMQDVFDLRSRALLVANSEKKDPETEILYNIDERKHHMQLFVENTEYAFQIAEICTLLHQSGHFTYQEFNLDIAADDTKSLESALSHLQTELDNWDQCLINSRRQYYPLNFVWGDQLMLLKDAIDSGDMNELVKAKSILRYIHPSFLKSPQLHQILGPSEEDNAEDQLNDLGRKLLLVTKKLNTNFRIIQNPPFMENHHLKIKPGELYIALLDSGSLNVIPVIMMLYGDTVKCFPEPSQILFCHEETSWEEINLLLQRCFHPSRQTGLSELFCLVNLEVLQGEMQTKLVTKVEYLIKEAETQGRTDFFLCFVTRSSLYSPVIDHFRNCTHRVHGLSNVEMENLLHTFCPDTYVVTSEVPGLGKTEYIKEKASLDDMGTATIAISGPFYRSKLVAEFTDLKVQDHQVLHIDIGMTPSPYSLDSFLFELIVVGAASSGTNITWLATDKIAIEVANSIQDKLQDSLTFSQAFKRVCLKWEHYKNFRISDEQNSSTQVVCQYLDAMCTGNIDEKNIYLIGKMSAQPIPERKCQTLLARYFDQAEDMSFTIALVFLDVLADQFKKMSASYFFRVENISAMLAGRGGQRIRYTLVEALINISKEFACRSVKSCRSSQVSAEKKVCEEMVDRVKGMIQWADSNHLMIVFQSQGTQTVSALYRNKDAVPQEIQRFFKSQLQKDLEDFDKLDQVYFQKKVERLVQSDVGQQPALSRGFLELYALTPDNFLKMVLISLRIKAGVPVILMGETGCGKTSLIKYLAASGNAKLNVFNFHAGITEQEITNRLLFADEEAKKTTSQYWLFLDEVNTCHHLGLLSEIICHHTCQGKNLTRNLVMIAACNPYRLRQPNQIMTSGLKSKMVTDSLSTLVYRVYPLPETMIDYVWDYGTLNDKDEMAYIERMMSNVFIGYARANALVPALVESQSFLRKIEETAWSVSLRDVNRCRNLMQWFYEMLKTKDKYPIGKTAIGKYAPKHVGTKHKNTQGKPKFETIRCDTAVLLALAHCYFSRIHKNEDRLKYLETVAEILYPSQYNYEDKARDLLTVIGNEQMDLLNRMEIGEGIAKNTALKENVFVLFVSILNKIPVFVVGKPGCSKSLSMQLLRSNLRGQDSKDDYFKTLPQLYVVSHQGSESSTSEGIEKVFKKAEQYLKHNQGQNVLPVVLLDEIGLAEVSRFNPLKVLHSLLEPTTGEVPNVAVVGISNWALDAAKMNRAIHLSRPDLDEQELFQTAMSIGEEYHKKQTEPQKKIFEKLYRDMARSYFEYQKLQKEKNFHGLRDYYALIKYISKQDKSKIENNTNDIILKGLYRNFGGMQMDDILQVFKMKTERAFDNAENDISTRELIKENLSDQKARYLMLITDGAATTGIVESLLQELGREFRIVIGSNFEEDQTEDYCYRILSQIILCMERGVILILKDLDPIYGSLYDMLNQNYTKSGNKLHCRVAIGPYSNPICHVHEQFRCIVLMDRKDINKVDPPFLNRFEKQQLHFSHMMTPKQDKIVKILTGWMGAFSTLEGHRFTKKHCFLGFHKDLIPSLVLSAKTGTINEYDEETESVKACQQKLLMVATPDAVQRLKRSLLATTEPRYDVQHAANEYFQGKIHRSLEDCITNISMEYPSEDKGVGRIVIYTHTSIHVDLSQHLRNEFPVMIARLGSFSSEKQMESKMKSFWFESDAKYFLLQCKPSLDAEHILLAKYQMENCRSQNKRKGGEEKIVIFIMHVGKNEEDTEGMAQFSFLNGWSLVTVDTLEDMEHPLSDFHDKSVLDILDSPILPLSDVVRNHLLWAFTCIKYQGSETKRNVQAITVLIKQISFSEGLMNGILGALKRIIEMSKDTEDSNDWQEKIACDVNVLGNATSFRMALCDYIENIVKNHLAKLVYRWEKLGIWDCFLAAQTNNDVDTLSLLEDWTPKHNLSDVTQVPDPVGSECYQIKFEAYTLKFPFVLYFENQLERVKHRFLQHVQELQENDEHLDQSGFLNWKCLHSQILFYSDSFVDSHRLLLDHPYLKDHIDVYIEDMITVAFPSLIEEGFIQPVQLVLEDRAGLFRVHDPIEKFVLSHLALWHLDPLITKLFHLAKSCIESIPSGSLKLKNLVLEKLEHFDRLRILEEKKGSTYILAMQDQNTHSSTDPGKEETTESVNREEDYVERTESQNRLDIDENSETVSMPSELATVTQEDAKSKENVVFIPNIPNDDENMYDSTQIQENESSADSLVHLAQEEKISNIEYDSEDINTVEKADSISWDSQIRAEEILVDYLCKEMFPTTESIEHNGDMKIWHGRALALLASARSLGCQHLCSQNFLSLCCDLTGMILIPYNISQSELIKLGHMGIDDKDEIMKNPNLLEFIFELTTELKSKVPVEHCQQFLCITLSRFIQFAPDSCMISTFLSKAVSGRMPDPNLNFFGPVLHNMLWCVGEDYVLFHIVCNILAGAGDISKESWGPLKYVDEELKKIPNNQMSRSFLILLTDIIEDLALQNLPDDFFQDAIQGKKTWDLLGKACEITILSDEISLQRIIAVAFIKKAFFVLAHQVKDREYKLEQFKEVNMALSVNSDENVSATRKTILVCYFLSAPNGDMSYGKLRDKAEQLSGHMPVLLDIVWYMKETIQGLGYNPLATHPYFPTIVQAWITFCTERKDHDLQNFLQKCSTSPHHFLGFLGFLMNSYTLIRPVRPIKDTEKQQMNYITENTSKLFSSWQLTVEKLLGKSDFNCQMLQLSEQSTLTQQQQASVLYHLMAVVVAHNPMSSDMKLPEDAPIFAKCMLTPQAIPRNNIPTWRESSLNIFPLFLLDAKMDPTVFTCKCGFINLTREKEISCQHCQIDSIQVRASILKENEKLFTQNKMGGHSTESYRYVGTMTPLSYRVLHLLMQGSLLLAHALDFWPIGQEPSHQDLSMEALLQQYETDWEILCEMLNETSDGVCRYVNMIIDKFSQFIAEDQNPCSSQEMKRTYEKKFSLLIQEQEQSRVQVTNDWYVRTCLATGYEQDGIESILGEIPKKRDLDIIPCLFRKKGTKTYESLRLQFMLKKKQLETPFLGYVLQFRKHLELLVHLAPLLKWHREIITHSNKQISKVDAKEYTIEWFLHKSEETREILFEEFSKAWNSIRRPENLMALGLGDMAADVLPFIHRGLLLKTCLITDANSPLMIMIKALMRVQNTTILQALRIALRAGDSSVAVGFYRRTNECTAAPCVYLQDASEKELMDFKWKEENLAFSQFNTGLGMGSEVIYDFKKIERVVANSLLHGKSFLLLDENFPFFIFSGQLFHSHSSILQDLSTKIPQANISQQIKSDLERKSDEPNYAKGLLNLLEIIIPYVNRQDDNTNRSLVQYIETNFSAPITAKSKELLPGHSDEIQLSHIVDLYESTEALLVKTAVESLDEKYRKPLPKDSKVFEELPGLESVLLEDVMTALGRIVKRYISSHQDLPKSDEILLPFMEKPGIWPQLVGHSNTIQETKIQAWFEYLQVCHIYELYSLVQESRKEKQPKDLPMYEKKNFKMGANLSMEFQRPRKGRGRNLDSS